MNDVIAGTKRVVCCACSQQCGLLAHVEDGRVTRLSGDHEHPSSQGFICPKGAGARIPRSTLIDFLIKNAVRPDAVLIRFERGRYALTETQPEQR